MHAIFISMSATVVFFAIALLAARLLRGTGWLAVVALFGAIVSLALGSVLLFLQATGTFVITIVVCLGGGRSVRASAWVLLMATAGSYGFMCLLAGLRPLEVIAEHAELQAMYPVISLEERLSYENEPPAVKRLSTPASGEASLSDAVDQSLRSREGRGRMGFRDLQLQRLHDRTSDQFLAAEGFGPMRFSGMSTIRLPSLPRLSPEYPEISATQSADMGRTERPTYVPARFMRMHEKSELDFLDRNRMGYVEGRGRVIGFEPHAFTRVPVPPAGDRPGDGLDDRDPDWTVVRVELLSLLKHEPPAAYVSEHLPRMDELREAPTRPLIAFEQAALERLRAEHDVVAERQTNVIRMVGSLRAGRDCLVCHRGSRGDLLGAISYELRRTRSLPAATEKRPGSQARIDGVPRWFAADTAGDR